MTEVLGVLLMALGAAGLWQAVRMTPDDQQRHRRFERTPLWHAGLAARLPLPVYRVVYALVFLVPIAIGISVLVG